MLGFMRWRNVRVAFDPSRVSQSKMTGIGFPGTSAIVKGRRLYP